MNIVDGVLVSFASPPKDVVISGVRVIGERAFQGSDIRSVDIRDVVDIRARAFMDCQSLEKVKLPDTLRKIGKFAFSSTAVQTIELPYAVQMGDDVFFDCQKLYIVVSDHKIPKYKLPMGCKVLNRAAFKALKTLGADGMYKKNKGSLSIRVPGRAPANDMPRESIRQGMKKKPKPKPRPKPKVVREPKRKRPRTPVPKGPRKGECTICLKPSCVHLNMSRRLGAPVMW